MSADSCLVYGWIPIVLNSLGGLQHLFFKFSCLLSTLIACPTSILLANLNAKPTCKSLQILSSVLLPLP
uniref:Uncharacterized protein n=1 Tax=Rhizophora mucronata TaxID=61149 RepID=A0A2P2NBZ8_RHIMU